MPDYSVTFQPHDKSVMVKNGTSLLEAAHAAQITIGNLCGGDGICGRCKMIVKEGEVTGNVSGKLTREQVRKGYVLACMTYVASDLLIEIPEETWAREKVAVNRDTDRFREFVPDVIYKPGVIPSPLVAKLYLELQKPDLANNTADHQRVCEGIRRRLNPTSMQMGLKVIQSLPEIMRQSDYKVTATVGFRKDIAEVMNVEAGNTEQYNFMVVVDIGTTTIVAHLVDARQIKTLDATACFNSQGLYGKEVTGRLMAAERKGTVELQRLLVSDLNMLIGQLCEENGVHPKDITAIVCAGNTAMGHFLLGLPCENIRRYPYVAASVEPPPLRAAEVGIEINSRGLLYSLPGISGWVGSDLTAGILVTEIHEKKELCLLIDIGTNGEIIVGNREWMVSCSASAGPAFEGTNGECGMRAERGAIEKVFAKHGKIRYQTIGDLRPKGICGSGIIDLVSVLLEEEVLNRSGKFFAEHESVELDDEGIYRFILVDAAESMTGKPIYISESDIENIITAKAAIFAAMKVVLERLDLDFNDIVHFYIAGGFGNYINIESAVNIGLIPNIERKRYEFVGNTSVKGAKLAAFYKEAFLEIGRIRESTTYYDLMGAEDYVDEFRKGLFLPHTDIELFQRRT
jgi:uncharacterized 2Fe-2S/4Fe-4S cluster protein (DUF4445 family)